MFVYTVIGAKVDAEDFKERTDLLIVQKGLRLEEAVHQARLITVSDNAGSIFLCTREHAFQIYEGQFLNYGPLVIYQDSNWNKDDVRMFLERLELWMPGDFGVWTFAAKG